jgi:lipooligosaccharide transport system ATP-binding protein
VPIIEARGLVKIYDGRRVVDDLDLTCRRGRVLGLLGPNGAGKTTTLRMLYGFIEPDGGEIVYEGRDFRQQRTAIKRWIGVCTQEDTLDHDFTVAQNLRVYANYFRPKVEGLDERIAQLIEMFGLGDYADVSPDKLSGGYIRRMMIARSIVHRPRVLFLDEPTTGLDPKARFDLWDLIDQMRGEGMAIILTTHYMDEAERLSDEVQVISRGRSVAVGRTEVILGSELGEHILVVSPDEARRPDLRSWLERHVDGRAHTILGELHVPIDAERLAAFSERFDDVRYAVRPPSLDDLFLKLSGEQGPERIGPARGGGS